MATAIANNNLPDEFLTAINPTPPRTWRVFKYAIGFGEMTVKLPMEAKILRVDFQRNQVCLWALVPSGEGVELRDILVLATGQEISIDASRLVYINTFLVDNNMFVFHAFEVVS